MNIELKRIGMEDCERLWKMQVEAFSELLEKYQVIKRHSTPPITRIREGRCGGCNMQLPAADMNRIRTGESFVECENCGRIILVK